jgi:hypothetical protein
MKKFFPFCLIVVLAVSALLVSTGTASAAAMTVVVYVPGATAKSVQDASLFVNSEYHSVNCVLKDAEMGKVVCKVSEKFASEGAVLYVAGQVAYLTLPDGPTNVNKSSDASQDSITCEEGQEPGAYVEFGYTLYDHTATWFVDGATWDEVATHASSYLGAKFDSFEIVSELECLST